MAVSVVTIATAIASVAVGVTVGSSMVGVETGVSKVSGWVAVDGAPICPKIRLSSRLISGLRKIIIAINTTIAPAKANDGVKRNCPRSHSNQLTAGFLATERGALGNAPSSWTCTCELSAASSVATLATGVERRVAATSANTCCFNWAAKSDGICFIGKCLRNNACSSCSFRLSAILKPQHLQMRYEIGGGHG